MCLGAPGFFYCLNLVFLFRYETDLAKMKPNEFLGENAGLIIAEVELENENQKINFPPWIDREVKDKK